MKYTLQDRLLKRELGQTSRYSKVRGIYADRQFTNDLDIVNELNGHSGCVNALRYKFTFKCMPCPICSANLAFATVGLPLAVYWPLVRTTKPSTSTPTSQTTLRSSLNSPPPSQQAILGIYSLSSLCPTPTTAPSSLRQVIEKYEYSTLRGHPFQEGTRT